MKLEAVDRSTCSEPVRCCRTLTPWSALKGAHGERFGVDYYEVQELDFDTETLNGRC